jgi:hypothetical protein
MKQILITSLLSIITITIAPIFINSNVNAWHENLGIDANKAAELYQSKPNDPAIVQWKNALQLAINKMGDDNCIHVERAVNCEPLMSTIISNCNSHPNELLACNDIRIAQYSSIMKNLTIAKEKAQEAEIKDLKKQYYSKYPEAIGNAIIDRCVENAYGSLKYNATSPFCDGELKSLQKNCEIKSTRYNYCDDQRLIGYFTQHNNLNKTAGP